MKIALIDKDIVFAAHVATLVKKTFQGVVVDYYDSLPQEGRAIATCTFVIADPSPSSTKEWLENFRRIGGSIPLLLVSSRTDLLSGSRGDLCYAMDKPVPIKDIVDLLKFVLRGRPYGKGLSRTERKSN